MVFDHIAFESTGLAMFFLGRQAAQATAPCAFRVEMLVTFSNPRPCKFRLRSRTTRRGVEAGG